MQNNFWALRDGNTLLLKNDWHQPYLKCYHSSAVICLDINICGIISSAEDLEESIRLDTMRKGTSRPV